MKNGWTPKNWIDQIYLYQAQDNKQKMDFQRLERKDVQHVKKLTHMASSIPQQGQSSGTSLYI